VSRLEEPEDPPPKNGTPLAGLNSDEGESGASSSNDIYRAVTSEFKSPSYKRIDVSWYDWKIWKYLLFLEAEFHLLKGGPTFARHLTKAREAFRELGTFRHEVSKRICWRRIQWSLGHVEKLTKKVRA
jgi:hypothetical protein